MIFDSWVILIGWLAFWFGGWAGYYLLQARGITYIRRTVVTFMYYASLSLAMVVIYERQFADWVAQQWQPVGAFALLLYMLLNLALAIAFTFGRWYHRFPRYYLSYAIVKTAEVFFQQGTLLLLLLGLRQLQLAPELLVIFGALLFGIVHVPGGWLFGRLHSPTFVYGSFPMGLLFCFCAVYFSNGVLTSYVLHWSAYVGIGAWVLEQMGIDI
jgi:hypothetical protein